MTSAGPEIAGPEIVVVGSINLDVSVAVPHLALPGETVLGGDALWSGGGKGANQAVAARRLGRSVAIVGAVGNDSAGHDQISAFVGEGIDVSRVEVLDAVPTGVALIAVDGDGENIIIVSPGANRRVSAAAFTPSDPASVLMVQFEIPLPVVADVVEAASGIVVVNPAPAPVDPDDQTKAALARIVGGATVLAPNRGELSALLGLEPAADDDELIAQAQSLGPSVVVTLGERGALVVENGVATHVDALNVEAVDATAAGDSFCAGLADALARGENLVDAARWATRVAAVTVTRRGAQTSLPTRAEVEAATNRL